MRRKEIQSQSDELVKLVTNAICLKIEDPRQFRGKRYSYSRLIECIVRSITCGANSILAIADLAPFFFGCAASSAEENLPKQGCFYYLLKKLEADKIVKVVADEINNGADNSSDQNFIHIDGKAQRGTKNLHVVHAVDANGNILMQETVADRSNEIPSAQNMLEALPLKDNIVTADAMHTQRVFMDIVEEKKGAYFLPVKDNQPNLHTQCKEAFDFKPMTTYRSLDYGHGRITQYTADVIEASIEIKDNFPGIKHVARITREREVLTAGKVTLKKSLETVHYITNLTNISAELANQIARAHWTVENKLHCVLDVTFCEDNSKFKNKKTANSLAAFRRIAILLLRKLAFSNIAQGRQILSTL